MHPLARRLPVFLVAAMTLLTPPCLGAEPAADWVKQHAIRLRSLEPADRDFSDLAPLKALIGDARVVMLGEQTHGDGATFLGKTRLIDFLHAEMGFDVLCFESGLYDCERAWQALRAGTDAATAMKLSVFGIWMQSRQLVPLTELMDRLAKTERPLELSGYDCQLTGPASRKHLSDDIAALAARGTPDALDATQRAAVAAYVAALLSREPAEAKAVEAVEAAIGTLARALDTPGYAAVPERERAFWKQMLKSLPAYRVARERGRQSELSLAERFNPRDEQGGDTLVWLARERYPGRKIIVWAASMHCVRFHERIQTGRENLDYAGTRSAGHVAAERLGDDVFIIAFTTGPGMAGTVQGKTWPVPRAPAGSLEAICTELELGPCVIPLRGAPDDSFGGSTFVARPLGNAPMRARWRDNVDAFVFTPKTFPSTRN